MAVADAHKVASAIEAVVHQADAAYIGVVAIMQTLFNKGQLTQAEVKDIADAMVASIPTDRHHAFAQSLAGMVPDYKSPRAKPIAKP
jgi:hypothetical protein